MITPNSPVFQVGNAKVDITPPLGVSLAGYFHDRVAVRVRDPLHARALVIGRGEDRVALLACDLCTVTREIVQPAKERIRAATGIPPERVLVTASHTHTGPEIRHNPDVPRFDEYVNRLPVLLAEAVLRAAEATVDATLHLGAADAEGLSFNRLFRLRNGSEKFGRTDPADPDVAGSAGPVDPRLQALVARDAEGCVQAVVANFALHADVIGGGKADFLSADWPGELCRAVESVYGDGTCCLFLQGTAGDINQHAYAPGWMPGSGPLKAMQIGRALAGATMLALERAQPMGSDRVAGVITPLEIPYCSRTPEHIAEVERLRQLPKRSYFEDAWIRRVESWPHDGDVCRVPVQALRVGDAAFVGFPAEVFVRWGLELKQYAPAGCTFPVELANERVSTYVPTTDQAERGAYGAVPFLSRWLVPDAGRRMVEQALRDLYQLWE
ncbi:MAG: neutral/alkaline non-lysosomal ceramidase N-terminal domain-containing protein [Lentisphaeria bacterium]|nr:neutral/alkaline non-lysosomal ceramidase N-terminal domain-containing protein [Lentisphaeria bacterium]